MAFRNVWRSARRPTSHTQPPLSCALSRVRLVLQPLSTNFSPLGPGQTTHQLKSSLTVQPTVPWPTRLNTVPNYPGAVVSPIDHRCKGSSGRTKAARGSQPRRAPGSQPVTTEGGKTLRSASGKGGGRCSEPCRSHRRESHLKRCGSGHGDVV